MRESIKGTKYHWFLQINSFLYSKWLATNVPTNVSYKIVNATAVTIIWNITGNVNGFIINITSSGLDTVTEQVTNSSVREFVMVCWMSDTFIFWYSVIFCVNCPCNYAVPSLTSFEAQPSTPTTILISWMILDTSIIHNYSVTVTCLCDNIVLPSYNVNGDLTNSFITGLLSGLEYIVSIIPINILGEGMERTDNVTIKENGQKMKIELITCNNHSYISFYRSSKWCPFITTCSNY